MITLWCCRFFKGAVEKQQDPVTFVEGLKKQGKRVSGIGHRIKSKDNRDARVELLQQYARKVRGISISGCQDRGIFLQGRYLSYVEDPQVFCQVGPYTTCLTACAAVSRCIGRQCCPKGLVLPHCAPPSPPQAPRPSHKQWLLAATEASACLWHRKLR